jgi:NAD(P)-dependent dehydrogenase (short-subunit alcohol dehydrogenase family)
MAGRLEGKVAVVTGGASGIGRACAERFAEEGARIVIGDLDETRGGATAAELGARGAQASFLRTDTSKEVDCDGLVAEAVRRHGKVDVLLAAAGISHALYVSGAETSEVRTDRTEVSILSKPTDYWEKVLNVNLTGVMMCDRAAARVMMQTGGGSIINIASGAAKIPIPGAAEYCVSKAGVWMLTKVLALEVARHKVRVNAIGPGFIETPMTASMRADEQRVQRLVSSIPLGRLGEPLDIANTALFLASDESSYFTGEILFPDGGMFTG